MTGAGSGIGRAVALGFVQRGYAVVLAGRRAELLQEAVRESAADEGRALAVRTDVTDPESVRRLFARTREQFGRCWRLRC